MNTRLVELYKQANKTAYEKVGAEHADTSYFQGIVNGMFAELVIAETFKVATVNMGYTEYKYVSRMVSEHFGVEL